MDLELISFKLCPFVQRAVITLRHKQVPYKVSYIDINDPPDWFKALSPTGKVPVLRVDNDAVLFESAVINEFVDEVTPGSMHPEDPLPRALNRAWIEFGSACLMDMHCIVNATDEEAFNGCCDDLHGKLLRLEAEAHARPYFNGDKLSLVDTAYAPLFMRLELLHGVAPIYRGAEIPKVLAWKEALLALPEVSGSVVEEFSELYWRMVKGNEGYVAAQVA